MDAMSQATPRNTKTPVSQLSRKPERAKRSFQRRGPFVDSSSDAEEDVVPKIEKEDSEPIAQPDDEMVRRESSEDDTPIMISRQLYNNPVTEREESLVLRQRRSLREKPREIDQPSSNNCPSRQEPKPSPFKERKKPGPRAWASKPIKKNDMTAKKATIREIEHYWGKGFIRAYIPKCHRPLVKRGPRGKRSSYREHETDPRNWLPSVLKRVLMIAKLVNDKKWLKKAMNDVVRYRIKHTGNRKPQLVTTDFDVIEDMYVKKWTVAYSFEIRYKHLLDSPRDNPPEDEDIDHILGVGCEDSGSSVDGEDADEDPDPDDDDDDDEGYQGGDQTSGKHLQSSAYTRDAYDSPAPVSRRQSKQPKSVKPPPTKSASGKGVPPVQQSKKHGWGRQMPGYPPMDPWGRPMPPYGGPEGYGGYGGFGPYGTYGGYGGYGPQYPFKQEGREGSQAAQASDMQLPPRHLMTPAATASEYEYGGRHGHFNNGAQMLPPGRNNGGYGSYERNMSVDMGHSATQGAKQDGAGFKIKRESPAGDQRALSPTDPDVPMNDLGSKDYVNIDADEAEDVEAEIAAAEIELKIARLRAKQAALKKARMK